MFHRTLSEHLKCLISEDSKIIIGAVGKELAAFNALMPQRTLNKRRPGLESSARLQLRGSWIPLGGSPSGTGESPVLLPERWLYYYVVLQDSENGQFERTSCPRSDLVDCRMWWTRINKNETVVHISKSGDYVCLEGAKATREI
jgi:hypothetical protein